jgi:hypothetical protein
MIKGSWLHWGCRTVSRRKWTTDRHKSNQHFEISNCVLAHGAGSVDGTPLVLCSTRAKLFGIAAPNDLLHHFMIFHKIECTSKHVKNVLTIELPLHK